VTRSNKIQKSAWLLAAAAFLVGFFLLWQYYSNYPDSFTRAAEPSGELDTLKSIVKPNQTYLVEPGKDSFHVVVKSVNGVTVGEIRLGPAQQSLLRKIGVGAGQTLKFSGVALQRLFILLNLIAFADIVDAYDLEIDRSKIAENLFPEISPELSEKLKKYPKIKRSEIKDLWGYFYLLQAYVEIAKEGGAESNLEKFLDESYARLYVSSKLLFNHILGISSFDPEEPPPPEEEFQRLLEELRKLDPKLLLSLLNNENFLEDYQNIYEKTGEAVKKDQERLRQKNIGELQREAREVLEQRVDFHKKILNDLVESAKKQLEEFSKKQASLKELLLKEFKVKKGEDADLLINLVELKIQSGGVITPQELNLSNAVFETKEAVKKYLLLEEEVLKTRESIGTLKEATMGDFYGGTSYQETIKGSEGLKMFPSPSTEQPSDEKPAIKRLPSRPTYDSHIEDVERARGSLGGRQNNQEQPFKSVLPQR